MKYLIILLALLLPVDAHSRDNHESWYVDHTCDGTTNVRLSDGTVVDCMVNDYVFEYDFANKWYEAIGQALHYSNVSGKKAGVVLIIENDREIKYFTRMVSVIEKFKLPIYVYARGKDSMVGVR